MNFPECLDVIQKFYNSGIVLEKNIKKYVEILIFDEKL